MNENQDVIFDNEPFFERLISELQKAERCIKVAAAWFTDPDLLNALISKAKEGIHVGGIISDNGNYDYSQRQH